MPVKLISYSRPPSTNVGEISSVPPGAGEIEELIAYCARVSNPNNQGNENFSGLLKYCIKHQHWSVFEQAHMTLEIETTRAIAAQILRHRSFTFQEFSQRYAQSNELGEIELPELRRQDIKNRQNSIDDLDKDVLHSINYFKSNSISDYWTNCYRLLFCSFYNYFTSTWLY